MEANLACLYIGIFPTAIAYATWAYAMSTGKASTISSMLYIEPVVAILVAWVWLHEWPHTLSIIGGIIAISGVIVVNLFGKEQNQQLEKYQKNTKQGFEELDL
jgi:drug/metabolite transporter (DMT)-like permease